VAYSFCAVVVSLTMVGEMKDILVRAVTLLLPLVLLDLLLELLPPPLLLPFLLPLLTPPCRNCSWCSLRSRTLTWRGTSARSGASH